jgi:hypothetical protein
VVAPVERFTSPAKHWSGKTNSRAANGSEETKGTMMQIEKTALELIAIANELARHRDAKYRSDDDDPLPETTSYNDALDQTMAEIDEAQGFTPKVPIKRDPVERELKRKIQAIGEQAHAAGGMALMYAIHDRVYQLMTVDGRARDADVAGSAIEHAWDGIGDWAR